MVGLSIEQTEAHRRHHLLVVAIKSHDGKLKFNPDARETFAPGDVLMLMGHRDHISQFRQAFRL